MAAFVSRYAHAFADVVDEVKLDAAELDRQLEDFLASWESSPELRECFANPAVAAKVKVAILDRMNEKLVLARPLRNLLAVLIDNNRIGQVREVIAAYRAEAQRRQGIHPVEITTARALEAGECEELKQGIGRLAGGRIAASFKLDPSILGGTVVRIGSTVYDGSVRGRLARLKEALTA